MLSTTFQVSRWKENRETCVYAVTF